MTAEYFDQWYADIAASDARQRLFTHWLGLPPEVGPSNLIPLSGLQEIAEILAVPRGGLLLDLACGRGGPGMWVARQAGARLIGVDFSAEAVSQATGRRALFGLESRAAFHVGTLDAPGLTETSADALMCIDAFQFAEDGVTAASGWRRLLRPGGRVVLTSWAAKDRGDESVPERVRRADLAGSLSAAGFQDIVVRDRDDWHALGLKLWEDALTLDAAGDPALESTLNEAARSVETHDRIRRVMVAATAP
jgi:SAM-dependent methyltransferase